MVVLLFTCSLETMNKCLFSVSSCKLYFIAINIISSTLFFTFDPIFESFSSALEFLQLYLKIFHYIFHYTYLFIIHRCILRSVLNVIYFVYLILYEKNCFPEDYLWSNIYRNVFFLSLKMLTLETICSTRTYTHTHTHPRDYLVQNNWLNHL